MLPGTKRAVNSPQDELMVASLRWVTATPNTNSPTVIVGTDFVVSVTRAGAAGAFDVTFRDTVAEIHCVDGAVFTNGNWTVTCDDPTPLEANGSKILRIRTKLAGSDTDPTAGVLVGVAIQGKWTKRVR